MKQRSWNYQERLRTFPLSVKNTTIFSTSRKQKSATKQPDILRTLENIFSVGQEYYNLFNFKKAKEPCNAAGIIKSAGEQFPKQPRILQSLQLQGSKRHKQRSWNCQERWRTFPLPVNNTTVSSTSRKQKNQTTQLELSRTLNNISSGCQEFYNGFTFIEEDQNWQGSWIFPVSQGFYIVQVYRGQRMEKMVQIRTLNNIPSLLVANSINCLQVQRKIKKNGK